MCCNAMATATAAAVSLTGIIGSMQAAEALKLLREWPSRYKAVTDEVNEYTVRDRTMPLSVNSLWKFGESSIWIL